MIKKIKLSDVPSRAITILSEVLRDKGSWIYEKGVLKGPNMYRISERYSNLWEYEWQEIVFFPRYFRMLHLIQLVKKDDTTWMKNHIHQYVDDGEEQDYFECFGSGNCDYDLNEALERVQYRFRLCHEEEWGPVNITEELVEAMNVMPASQLPMF